MMVSKLLFRFALSATLASLCGVGAMAQTSARATKSSEHGNMTMNSSTKSGNRTTDQAFIKKAAQGGMAEVEFGKLATEKASNPEVKKFGQRMVDDHSKANDQLKEVASTKNITLPTRLDAKDEMTKKKLEALSGAQFDKAYMSDMVKDHTKDVAEFQRESKMSKDPAVKGFASQTLPTLEEHLREAKRIAPQVEGKTGGTK